MRWVSLALVFLAPVALAQPITLSPQVTVTRLATVASGTVRIVREPTTGDLITQTLSGDVYRYTAPYTTGVLIASEADHGLGSRMMGLAINDSGTLFLVNNLTDGVNQSGIIKRGVPEAGGGYAWSTVAQTEWFVGSSSRQIIE